MSKKTVSLNQMRVLKIKRLKNMLMSTLKMKTGQIVHPMLQLRMMKTLLEVMYHQREVVEIQVI